MVANIKPQQRKKEESEQLRRERDKIKLIDLNDLLLEIKRTHLVTAGERSFVHVAPWLWDEPPYSLSIEPHKNPFEDIDDYRCSRCHSSNYANRRGFGLEDINIT